MYKLHRKGLNVVCIPRSLENDIAATMVSFGFNTALSFTIEMLDRVRQAAQSARKLGVVEVLGRAGRLAGIAGRYCGVRRCGADSRDSLRSAKSGSEVEGKDDSPAALRFGGGGRRGEIPGGQPKAETDKPSADSLKASLSPLATGEKSEHVIQRSGQAAETVATRLQLLIAEETYPLVMGPWVRGGVPTAVDRQLGLAYGAGAVRALTSGKIWGDGGLFSAGHPIRAAGGSHQQESERVPRTACSWRSPDRSASAWGGNI